jgi:hypothetical protein
MSTLTDRVPSAPAAKPLLKRSIGLWMATAFMLLLFGIPVFVWMKWRQSKEPVEIDAAVFALQRPLPPPPEPSRRVPVHTR